MLSIKEELFGEKGVVLRLEGDLDEIEINTLYNRMYSLSMNDLYNVVINFDKVESVDYFAMGFLIARRDFYKENNGDLKLVSINYPMGGLLDLINIDSHLDRYRTESEAIESFEIEIR